MNLLPTIDKPKRGFKFSNPLSGTTYNNNFYLQQCDYQSQKQIVERQSPKKIMLNLKEPGSRTKYWNKLSDSKINYSQVKTNNGNMSYSFHLNKSAVPEDESSINRGLFKFPDIQIKIIDQISSYRDFIDKNLRINLAHYFAMFFRKCLAGGLTHDFVDLVQKYLHVLASKMCLDTPADTKDFPIEIFSLKSKRAFVEKILELEEKKSFRPIEEMIKFYCIPTKDFRDSCFRDILHMISQSLYEKFNLNKEKEYVLLDENGHVIEDICTIKFSTTHLLITGKLHHERAFHAFRAIIESNLQNFKKISFSDELKKNFRGIIAAGKFEETNLPEPSPFASTRGRRIIGTRNELKKTQQKSPQKMNPAKTTTQFLIANKQHRSRSRKTKSSLDGPVPVSLASGSNFSAIADIKIRSISARKRYESYREAFEKLRIQNNNYDITFNHTNPNKLLMAVFKKDFPQFHNKSQEQIDRIMQAFDIASSDETIKWEDYHRICEVANCKGDHLPIINFVTKYLPFNEYGELDKPTLAETIRFILNQVNGEEVVLQIIWSWLQKNNLIENSVLLRNTLDSWYSNKKMAFVIIVSLIFGNNETSLIDMAYEVLI